MAAFGAFQFASPAQYGDWAQYAGFNRTTGEIENVPAAQGVKPPENMQQYMQQRTGPAQARMAAVVPAMQQMSQGNVVQGIGTFRAGQPAAATPQAPAVDYDYDYTPRF